ncbi:IniB N-terminal domain-containing protein [Dactylosporangium sp. NBC_01737]|uniref:IniB N-terminal domain-containing protein n=1 Tax=Dactylosporangium sp. NBC_01737 TaxID=2975959 RepID=UPI002E14D7AE|nr:IniB N-terminal domain-containing protein [Dactylosporangium sp. NBC_01737]
METLTLHDFVLTLITDPAARTAFELDPEGVLVDAGLGDITEADVQEVIPLVMDYAPVGGLTSVVGADEPVLSGFDGDVTGAVRQLQGISQLAVVGHNHGSDLTVNATAAAGVSVNLGELPLATSGLPVLGGSASGGFDMSLLGDPSDTLDAVDPVLGTIDPVLGTVDPVTSSVDPALQAVDPILGGVDPLLGGVYGTVDVTLGTVSGLDPVTGAVDSLGLGGLTGTGTDTHALVDPLTGTVTHTVDSTVSGVSGSVLSGHGGGLVGDVLGGDTAAGGHDQDGLLGHLH